LFLSERDSKVQEFMKNFDTAISGLLVKPQGDLEIGDKEAAS